jgi:glycosyltransferase involved in cell wall biosynthesis
VRISVGMLAYNSGPIIEAAIKSSYDFVDEIFVIDGSADGLSTDDTAKIAVSCGPKVSLFQGTFKDTNGVWSEAKQRDVYTNILRPWNPNDWILYQDSDEVFARDEAALIPVVAAEADSEVKYISFRAFHFWNDCHHIITGDGWDFTRPCGLMRLRDRGTLTIVNEQIRMYHYGHILSKERVKYKIKQYFMRGDYASYGWPAGDWDAFYKEFWQPYCENPKYPIKPFSGVHPEDVRKISFKLFGEQL